ncbi:MAG: phosphatidylserine/phosphatidylglycerophosphate/cardiolipin synthase family protein [Gemmatimonadales bacterium]
MWIVLAFVAGVLLAIVVANLSSSSKKVERRIEHLYGVREPQFVRSMGSLLGPPVVPGNRVTALCNGDEIFPAMLETIRGATKTICFETFIYWSGSIGREFAEALSDRARAGVKVHVMLDWVGSNRIDESLVKLMTDAGVQAVRYHPLRWYNVGRLNNRTHRKLLIVDGRIGFTGGVGIADNWLGHAQDPDHWRDSHYRLEGPAVAHMQAAFVDNWMETCGEVLHGEEYFPPLEPVGSHPAQLFRSSADDGSESVRLMYFLSLASAERSVRLANAYFVPDSLAVRTLVDARRRGATVEIIVPGRHIDQKLVRRASRALWGPLLEAGVAIYEYQPTMYHVKVAVVDEIWTSVGSTNFDSRSFRLNDEANLNVLDPRFAEGQVGMFEEDKRRARRITLEEWRHRPWRERATEWVAALFRMQL